MPSPQPVCIELFCLPGVRRRPCGLAVYLSNHCMPVEQSHSQRCESRVSHHSEFAHGGYYGRERCRHQKPTNPFCDVASTSDLPQEFGIRGIAEQRGHSRSLPLGYANTGHEELLAGVLSGSRRPANPSRSEPRGSTSRCCPLLFGDPTTRQ